MANKKYTLYFKGINEYRNEHNFPIISLDLKKLDEYTSNYDGYLSLFNSLPKEIKKYIKDNLGYMVNFEKEEDLKDHFFITDEDFNPIIDVIFEKDIDVLYVEQEELESLIVSKKMSFSEFQNAQLRSSLNKSQSKYDFFKYLYETYVKDQKIACMIDVYDINKEFPNLLYDDAMIASIATDKDNIIVLCKKLGQNLESRRNLAFKFKKLFNVINKTNTKIIGFSLVETRKNKNLDINELHDKMMKNFNTFRKSYEKEYHG